MDRGTVYSSLRREGPVRDADARLPGRIRANKRPIGESSYRLRGSTVHEVAGMSALRAQWRAARWWILWMDKASHVLHTFSVLTGLVLTSQRIESELGRGLVTRHSPRDVQIVRTIQ